MLFINNEHCIILNTMPKRTPLAVEPYQKQLDTWLPGAKIAAAGIKGRVDALLKWRKGGKTVTYVLQHKANLATQDARVVAQQLRHVQKPLLLAPFIRREQGVILQQHGIEYLDLAGNAHIEAPGVFVHVEGLRPAERPAAVRARFTRGWTRTVMALLIRPELLEGPYRPIADAADVALGTVTACFRDLNARGLVRGQGRRKAIVHIHDLLALWVQAYVEVLRPRLNERRFHMKVTDKHQRWERLTQVLGAHDVHWALTGADAALLVAPHLRTDDTEIYAPPGRIDDRELVRELEAQPAVRGNLRVIEPPAPIAVPETPREAGPPATPVLLAYAELRYRGGDQANEAADLLLPRVLEHAHA